jgi:peptide/nickel transport system substrate-binding protein
VSSTHPGRRHLPKKKELKVAIQRKRGTRTLALLGAVAMFAAACGSDDGDDTAAPSETETTDETTEEPAEPAGEASCGTTNLVWAHEQEPPDMHLDDPNNNLSITSWILQSMQEGLYGVSATTEFFPEMLADEITVTENADGTITYDGVLRDGLTWSDGTPVTAQQVVDTQNIIMEGFDAETGEGGIYLIGDRTGYDAITDISASSDTEFSYTMDGFFAGYKAMFNRIMPTHIVADAATANEAFTQWELDGTTLPSTGPMLWGSWNVGTSMDLVTNESYHGSVSPDVTNGGVACVTGVTINFVPDTDTQINALQAGEADIVFTQPQLQFEGAIAEDPTFTVASEAGPVYEHWGLNVYNVHLADPLVREALALAMDKGEVMAGLYTPLFGDSLPAEGLGNTYWMSNQGPYIDNAGSAGYGAGDAASAIANLEAAGYADSGDGIYEHPEKGRLTLRVGTTGGNGLRELQQQILQQQYAAAGIEIVIDNVDGAAYFGERPFAAAALACAAGTPDGETVGEGDEAVTSDCGVWDITQFAWVGGPWPGGNSAAFLSGSGNNPYGYANADFDAQAVVCDATIDDTERAACYNEMDAYVTTLTIDPNGLVALPLTQKPSFFAYSNERLVGAGVAPDANDAGPIVNVVDYQPAG